MHSLADSSHTFVKDLAVRARFRWIVDSRERERERGEGGREREGERERG